MLLHLSKFQNAFTNIITYTSHTNIHAYIHMYVQYNVAHLLNARTVKTRDKAVARQCLSTDHLAAQTDKSATVE
jgi:hypothetical protein